jgi:membrane protein DedA with SNARE-associated domain
MGRSCPAAESAIVLAADAPAGSPPPKSTTHWNFMHDFFHTPLPQLLSQYGYIILFPAGVVAGPPAYVVAGALIAGGALNAVIVTLMLVAADLVGDAAYYSLGRWGHGPLMDGLGRRLNMTPERLQPIEDRFRRNDWILVLVGKSQAFGAVVLYAAGATRMNFVRFLWWNLVATIPKIILFELVGYFFGATVMRSQHSVDVITFVLFGAALVLLIGYWLSAKYLTQRDDRAHPHGPEGAAQLEDGAAPQPVAAVVDAQASAPKVAVKTARKPRATPPQGEVES